jgi:5-methylcytosine-specific restriction endonuclease McrA
VRRVSSEYADHCQSCSQRRQMENWRVSHNIYLRVEINCVSCGVKAMKNRGGKFEEHCSPCSMKMYHRQNDAKKGFYATIICTDCKVVSKKSTMNLQTQDKCYSCSKKKVVRIIICEECKSVVKKMNNPSRVKYPSLCMTCIKRRLNRENHGRWRRANPDRLAEIQRRTRARNAVKNRRKMQEYRLNNKEIFRRLNIARRARKRSALGFYSVAEWKALVTKHKGCCVDCGKKGNLTVGHLIPLSKGGSNWIGNIKPQCGECNSRQSTKVHPLATLSLFDRLE